MTTKQHTSVGSHLEMSHDVTPGDDALASIHVQADIELLTSRALALARRHLQAPAPGFSPPSVPDMLPGSVLTRIKPTAPAAAAF